MLFSSSQPEMKAINPLITFEQKRDAYGFTVQPQHLQKYRAYAKIYKEEEEERSDRWISFLERQAESSKLATDRLGVEEDETVLRAKASEQEADVGTEKVFGGDELSNQKCGSDSIAENDSQKEEAKVHRVQLWSEIRPSLHVIEDMMSIRVKKKTTSIEDVGNKKSVLKDEHIAGDGKSVSHTDGAKSQKGTFEEHSEDEFYVVERSGPSPDTPIVDGTSAPANGIDADTAPLEASFPWKEELEVLVRGGVPMALRGELWQAFVGVKARRVEKYYQSLLVSDDDSGRKMDQQSTHSNDDNGITSTNPVFVPEKWKGQIEKDLHRTFPGHPALDEDGRNALRRLLTAYARHNPSVGYCQAMNFFAGLLLLLMSEENAFWTLMGILDDYFDGYYSEEMLESRVDQLVFEELVREKFPKLANHLDYLGVQVAWVTGPWFLSIFVNMLPWESVLRVWDVLLFEGNRVMLFKTAVALMELYGPALVTTADAGDAITSLQSLAGSTFDSSQLVLMACMGYQNINEIRLQELRNKHRPAVIAAVEERSEVLKAWRDSKGRTSKKFGFKHDPKMGQSGSLSRAESGSTNREDILISLTGEGGIDSVPDLQEQVVWLKDELCRLQEEKRSALLRAEELETALMEMVKQDNRRQLSAKVEQLEQEIAELRQAHADKQEHETAILQVLMSMEQEQKVTQDARRFAEEDAAAQRYATEVLQLIASLLRFINFAFWHRTIGLNASISKQTLRHFSIGGSASVTWNVNQEKYDEAAVLLAEMENRAVIAESLLEATLQYQSGQVKLQANPRSSRPGSPALKNKQEPTTDVPTKRIGLLLLGWRNRNKGKPTGEEPTMEKPMVEAQSTTNQQDGNGLKVEDGRKGDSTKTV
ncbi:unnamed protein product [Lupinus luteus]|uniref:Rab-GAP TBC domain-containing protein n=1 Tax=Lupinus luteus TaxID=3873 RepID=A0AAV1VUB2_LUPLU